MSVARSTRLGRPLHIALWFALFVATTTYVHTSPSAQVAPLRRLAAATTAYIPDLVGAGFDVLDGLPVNATGQVAIDIAVANQGQGDAGPFNMEIVLSFDDAISSSDQVVDRFRVSGIPAGSTYTTTRTVQLPTPDPFPTDNEYWIGMIIDADREVAESDEDNNYNQCHLLDKDDISSEKHVLHPTEYHMVLAEPAILPGTITGGIGTDEWIGPYDIDTYYFYVPSAQSWAINVRPTSGQVIPVFRLYKNDPFYGPIIASGQHSVAHFPGADTYYLAVMDAVNLNGSLDYVRIREAGATGDYELVATPLPDLRVLAVSHFPEPASPGQTVRFSVSVINEGLGDVGSFDVGFWANRPEEPGLGDPPDAVQSVAGLAAGEIATVEFDWPAGAVGSSTAWFCVDSSDSVEEGSEDNNLAQEDWSVAPASAFQIVEVQPPCSPAAPAGRQFGFAVVYDTSDANSNVTGLGLRLHYDSSKVTFVGLSDVLSTGLVQQQPPTADSFDWDGDPATDKYVLVAWADVHANWPGVPLPVTLYNVALRWADGLLAGTTTTIRFSAASTAAGYGFEGPDVAAEVVACTLDVDDNGAADALTDGIIILRYLFGFRGDPMVEGALAPDAQRTDPAEIASFLDGCREAMLDVDCNGQADALSDGIIILRYLFGFRGDALVQGALAPDAQRTTPAAIASFLDAFLP